MFTKNQIIEIGQKLIANETGDNEFIEVVSDKVAHNESLRGVIVDVAAADIEDAISEDIDATVQNLVGDSFDRRTNNLIDKRLGSVAKNLESKKFVISVDDDIFSNNFDATLNINNTAFSSEEKSYIVKHLNVDPETIVICDGDNQWFYFDGIVDTRVTANKKTFRLDVPIYKNSYVNNNSIGYKYITIFNVENDYFVSNVKDNIETGL